MIVCVCASAADARETAQRVHYADEAGSAHIAIMSITPWDEAKADLQPSFPLTEADALAKVLPSTGQTEDRLLDIVAASLKVATPTITTGSVTETKTATGQPNATTSNATRTKASGDVSKVPDVTASTATAAGLPGAPASWSGTLDNDPMLVVLAATALKQEYALVNRYVKDTAIEKGPRTHSYVVRMQFTTLPSRRNLPYDVFTNVSFLPGKVAVATGRSLTATCKNEGTITVVPLLVTDDIEGMLTSRTTDKVRQFGLSLMAMLSGVGISASAQRNYDNLNHSLGKELNSLFTIARLSSDTIRVRLGANSSPSPVDYAMVPRTHNISLLVTVTPSADTDCFGGTAVARTEFHDTESGHILKDREYRASDLRREARELGVRYAFTPKLLTPGLMGTLGYDAGKADVQAFNTAAKGLWPNNNAFADAMSAGLYADILATKSANYFTYADMQFDTAPPSPIMPVLDQAVLVSVSKSPTTVHLDQGLKLAASELLATLTVEDAKIKGDTFIVASAVTPTSGGTGLDIGFPALKPFGIGASQKATLQISSAEKPVSETRNPHTTSSDVLHIRMGAARQPDALVATYANLKLVADDDAPPSRKPAYTLARSADAIVAAADSSGQVSILLKSGGGTGSATVGITGGDLTAVSNTSGTPIAIANGVMTVSAPGAATLSLRNLHSGGKVGIQLYDSAGKKSGDLQEFSVRAASDKDAG